MMGGIPTKVTGQALTVNEKGEDGRSSCLPLVKSLVYRYTALTVFKRAPLLDLVFTAVGL